MTELSAFTPVSKRRRFTPIAIVAGLAGTLMLSLTMTGTLSGFVATITNTTNTVASGTLIMEETSPDNPDFTCSSTDGGSVSANSASCSTINKFGGSTTMTPGESFTSDVVISNVGTIPAAGFALTNDGCTQSNNGSQNGIADDFCDQLNISIVSNGTTVFTGTAADLGSTTTPAELTMPSAPAAGESVPFTFTVTFNNDADNSYQGLAASMPLTWTFTS